MLILCTQHITGALAAQPCCTTIMQNVMHFLLFGIIWCTLALLFHLVALQIWNAANCTSWLCWLESVLVHCIVLNAFAFYCKALHCVALHSLCCCGRLLLLDVRSIAWFCNVLHCIALRCSPLDVKRACTAKLGWGSQWDESQHSQSSFSNSYTAV